MAHKSLVPKQRCLTPDETPTSFESWTESLVFHISLSDKSARFLSTGDLSTWTTAADRGFTDDVEIGTPGTNITAENRMNRQTKISLLDIILGSIASYATVISAKFIKKQSTSLESIWERLRSYYGFRRVGSRILEITDIKLEMNESKESLWERMYSFLEDQLLTKNGAILHEGVKRETDEELSPTLLNLLVTLWLHIINPSLPSLVKQRFSTQLRTQTVYSIREEISDSIPILLNELEEKECSIGRTGAYNRYRNDYKGNVSKNEPRSRPKFNRPKYSNYRNTKRNCCLCEAHGRPADHFLSSCPYLPPGDKAYFSNSKTRDILANDDDDEESEDELYEEDLKSADASLRNLKIHKNPDTVMKTHQNPDKIVNIRRVDIFASPTMDVNINTNSSRWTLDSGAEANVITISECNRIGIDIYPTSQSATQGDGKTPLPTFGEVHFIATRGHHKLFFNGLVVEHLDTPVLAGMPFHKLNHIQINYSQNVIVLEDCCRIKFDPRKRKSNSTISTLRVARQTCILPGEDITFTVPSHVPLSDPVAIEPRMTVPKDMPDWIKCEIINPNADGSISIKNNTTEPVLLGKHTQACQIRLTTEIKSPSFCQIPNSEEPTIPIHTSNEEKPTKELSEELPIRKFTLESAQPNHDNNTNSYNPPFQYKDQPILSRTFFNSQKNFPSPKSEPLVYDHIHHQSSPLCRPIQTCQQPNQLPNQKLLYNHNNQNPSNPQPNKPIQKFNARDCVNLSEVNTLSKSEKEIFRGIHEDHGSVFTPGIGCYNNYSGKFQHYVNIGPNLPPQRRGRIPDYSNNDKELLQSKFDELLSEGVFARAEEVNQPVEYVHPSFLIRKPSGGFRLVTSFGEMAEYAKPQPTINSNIEAALQQIGQWKVIIITDLKESYFQIPLNPESSKYVGVITPYTGTLVYRRSVMGLPGSEAALEELLSRIFGDLIRNGKMVKIADDIFLGSHSVESLSDTWREVLKRLELNGLKLSPTKTKICPTSATILGWEWSSGSIQPGKHRVNALINCEPPPTTKALRSYLGCYKYMARVIPNYAEILRPLEEAVGGKQSSDKIDWSEELLNSFNKSKEQLKKIKPITLPRREDQLHIITDASSVGIAGTLFIVRDKKPIIAGYYNAALKGNQAKLVPCELEALAISCSLKHFSPLIIQSLARTRIYTDSRPCCLAHKNLMKGKFSSSPKVTTFLSMATRFNVELLHISGSSNIFSDFASRNPVECTSINCSVCAFVNDTSNSCVGEISVSDVMSGKTRVPYTTKLSWLPVQRSCPDLLKVHKYLTSNASIPKKRKKLTDVKRYVSIGVTVLTGHLDGLLVIKQSTPFKPTSYRVVIPRNVSDGLLTALHIQLNHPSTHQLKLLFSREFFCLDLDAKAKKISDNCYTCAALKKVPTLYHEQTTSKPEETIGQKFSVDVVLRYSQCIVLLRESITSFTDGIIIANEKAATLRDALILLMSRLKSQNSPKAIVRTDPASGFRSLINDETLKRFQIEIELGEAKNPNKNPIAESAIKELHLELLRLKPQGGQITETILGQALSRMNDLIRHHKLSAREAWTKREMSTGKELNIKDENLINTKYERRLGDHEASAKYKARGKPKIPHPVVNVGNLVYIYSDRSKLKMRDKYLVTAVQEDSVTVQKFTNDQFRKRSYSVKKSDLIVIQPDPESIAEPQFSDEDLPNPVTYQTPQPKYHAPIQKRYNLRKNRMLSYKSHFVESSSDSEESDEEYEIDNLLKLFLPNPMPDQIADVEYQNNMNPANVQMHIAENPTINEAQENNISHIDADHDSSSIGENSKEDQLVDDPSEHFTEDENSIDHQSADEEAANSYGLFDPVVIRENLKDIPSESFSLADNSQFNLSSVENDSQEKEGDQIPELNSVLAEISPIFRPHAENLTNIDDDPTEPEGRILRSHTRAGYVEKDSKDSEKLVGAVGRALRSQNRPNRDADSKKHHSSQKA